MGGSGSATPAENASTFVHQPGRSLGKVFRARVVNNLALNQLGQARGRKGKNRKFARLGDHADDVQHALGPDDTVRSDSYHTAEVVHLFCATRGKAVGEHFAIFNISLADDDR